MLFAQTTTPAFLGNWIMAGSVILNIVGVIVTIIVTLRAKRTQVTLTEDSKQHKVDLTEESKKIKVGIVSDCADKNDNQAEHQRLEAKIDSSISDAFKKIGGVERGARHETDSLRREVNQRIDSIHRDINMIPSRIIADLRNAGALK